MGTLTALHVRNAKPGRHADGKGLYLLVKPSGARSWVLRIVVSGRRRDFGLGPVDLVSLTEARDKATEGRRLVRNGLDPGVEWKRSTVSIPTFAEVARKLHETNRPGWRNAKHAAQWLSTLQTYAFPTLGRRLVDQIDASAIWSALGPIWQSKPETARRVRQRIGTVLDYAKAHGWRETEAPMRALAQIASRQQRKPGHFAAMPYAELPGFMGQLRTEAPSIGRLALQFTILTAARSGEVRGATWEEMDVDAATWSIPAERMKGGEAHTVALSPAAVEILREVRGLGSGRKGEPVFPGLRGRPLSDATLSKALGVAGGADYTVHGFRSSFRDWVAEQTSFPGEWAEAALAHKPSNKVEAAYRRTRFLEQRRKLMAAWADYLGGGGKVVRLAAAR
jgi:integrase